MSSQRNKTFRLSLIRRRIVTLCQSRALRAALLAALNGGPDATLVVEMVERIRPPARLPIQMVTPVPQQQQEEARVEEPAAPVPPRQEGSNQTQPQGNRNTERNPIVIEDSDSELND